MKKFAQIVDNKIHWIFEAEEKPQFAPYIILVDITGIEDIEEGWYYNKDTNTFSEMELNHRIIEEKVDTEKIAMAEAIVDLNNRIMELESKLLEKEGK